MSSVGIVKEILGSAFVKDENGELLGLIVGDSVTTGDTIITNSINDKVVIALGDKEITLIGSDALKLDQSVVLNESFGEETSLQVASVQTAILDLNLSDFENMDTGSDKESAALSQQNSSLDDSKDYSADFTLDLSKVASLESMSINQNEKLEDGSNLKSISKQDLLDISDKDKGAVLKIDGEPTSGVTLSKNELKKDESAATEKFDAASEKGTISIKIDTDIQTDFS
ncbi:hypothetical protein ACPF04_02830 [Campylobacter sp. MOP51]|uniref:hypothetical protein n=1 Tax=Campylobacter canis TaxID=3378588 RepID=UPI003C6B415D